MAAAVWHHTTLPGKATGWVSTLRRGGEQMAVMSEDSMSRGPVYIHLGTSHAYTTCLCKLEACRTPDISSSFLLGLDVAAVLPCNAQLHLFSLLLLVFRILLVVHIKESAAALSTALEA